MIQLIYCSIAKNNIQQSEIDNILSTARNFNSKNNISGCLLFFKNEFIQILEGEEKVVKDLHEHIITDKRHSDALLLAIEPIKERKFNDWSMAFHKLETQNVQILNKEIFINNFVAINDARNHPAFCDELFWNTSKRFLNKERDPARSKFI